MKKANLILGQLLCAFTYRDKLHFIHLYKVYVRCHLEYAVQSWSPYLQQDKNLIEDVQKRAIRQVSGLQGSYEEKLAQVGLTTLIDRRARGDFIQTYKIMHQVDDIPVETFFKAAGEGHEHALRGAVIISEEGETKNMNLSIPETNCRTLDLRRYSFSHRVVNPWNNLPDEVKFAESVNQFKNLYDDHMK